MQVKQRSSCFERKHDSTRILPSSCCGSMWISPITYTDFVFTVIAVPTPLLFFFFPPGWWCWLSCQMRKNKPFEEKTLNLHSSTPAVWSYTLFFTSTSNWASTGNCWAKKKSISCSVKSLAAQLLDWLTVGLIDARAKGTCGTVAKGGRMWP